MATRTAARLIVDSLRAHGVDLAYCVPGESYLAVTDALIEAPDIRLIVCRHEGGAGFMTVADAKITGKPGVCFVSRGPGATNVSIAIHTAKQDATATVFFVGQAERPDLGRGALQEVDYSKTFSDMAKLVIDVRDASLVSEAVARAFHVAESGTPGPVVVVLPEDMLGDETNAPVCPPRPMPRSAPTKADVEKVAEMLAAAEKPLVIVGGTYRGDPLAEKLVAFAEALELPITTVNRRPHLYPNDHKNYAGCLGIRVPAPLIGAMREADLILTLGARMTDSMSQGYTFPRAPIPDQPLIHVYPDPEEIGRVWHPTAAVACEPLELVEALLERRDLAMPKKAGRGDWISRLVSIERGLKEYEHRSSNDGVVFGAVVHEIGKHLKRNAVVTTDAGNFGTWAHRYLGFFPEGEFIGALSGAMGGGVPFVVAAGMRDPNRQLIGFVGDGGFLMTGNELATALQYGVPVKIFVSNNGSYGTIRMHQELRFPGRETSTALRNPNFAKMGEAFGALGLRIENDADVAPMVKQAMEHDGPVLVEVMTSLAYMTAWKTLDDLANDAAARKAK